MNKKTHFCKFFIFQNSFTRALSYTLTTCVHVFMQFTYRGIIRTRISGSKIWTDLKTRSFTNENTFDFFFIYRKGTYKDFNCYVKSNIVNKIVKI